MLHVSLAVLVVLAACGKRVQVAEGMPCTDPAATVDVRVGCTGTHRCLLMFGEREYRCYRPCKSDADCPSQDGAALRCLHANTHGDDYGCAPATPR